MSISYKYYSEFVHQHPNEPEATGLMQIIQKMADDGWRLTVIVPTAFREAAWTYMVVFEKAIDSGPPNTGMR